MEKPFSIFFILLDSICEIDSYLRIMFKYCFAIYVSMIQDFEKTELAILYTSFDSELCIYVVDIYSPIYQCTDIKKFAIFHIFKRKIVIFDTLYEIGKIDLPKVSFLEKYYDYIVTSKEFIKRILKKRKKIRLSAILRIS